MRKLGWWLLLIPLFFNMLVCACSGRVGWMLFWAIAFSSCAYEYGYEYGKTKERLSSQSAAEPIYETNYFDDDCACRIRMRKPQRSPPQIRATISGVAAPSGDAVIRVYDAAVPPRTISC